MRTWQVVLSVAVAWGVGSVAACGNAVTDLQSVGAGPDTSGSGGAGGATGSGGGSSGGGGTILTGPANKVDVLLMIDNSGSMSDKQQILRVAVPDLVKGLVARQIDDVHFGVITSSLGGHGSDTCVGDKTPSENDHGRLIHRGSTDGSKPDVATWADKGFLLWDPKGKAMPPGESDAVQLSANLAAMVAGAGEVGCGFENQLEAWYRFAVDPDPYDTIVIENNSAVLKGTDLTLLKQRAQFLRPDSALVIVMLTDENDASLRDGSQYFYAFQRYQPGTNKPYHLPKPRAACATDPNSDCCRSCGQAAGAGCDTSKDDCTGTIALEDDAINLRAFDQKHRFGIDFLQPLQRYQDGLSKSVVFDRFGQAVPNPIYPSNGASGMRPPSWVFLAGIVGVPWQDIARRNAAGKPDLLQGLDGGGKAAGGFQSAAELAKNGVWAVILGDTSCEFVNPACRPKDPLMIESIAPRLGTNPVTGDPLAQPQDGDGPNPINGHEWKNSAKNDLQYACIFDLPEPIDCSVAAPESSCECKSPDNPEMKPLCNGATGQTQARAKAYPGRRELGVLKSLGQQGIVASICPAQLKTPGSRDYGYVAAMGAVLDAIDGVLPKTK